MKTPHGSPSRAAEPPTAPRKGAGAPGKGAGRPPREEDLAAEAKEQLVGRLHDEAEEGQTGTDAEANLLREMRGWPLWYKRYILFMSGHESLESMAQSVASKCVKRSMCLKQRKEDAARRSAAANVLRWFTKPGDEAECDKHAELSDWTKKDGPNRAFYWSDDERLFNEKKRLCKSVLVKHCDACNFGPPLDHEPVSAHLTVAFDPRRDASDEERERAKEILAETFEQTMNDRNLELFARRVAGAYHPSAGTRRILEALHAEKTAREKWISRHVWDVGTGNVLTSFWTKPRTCLHAIENVLMEKCEAAKTFCSGKRNALLKGMSQPTSECVKAIVNLSVPAHRRTHGQ